MSKLGKIEEDNLNRLLKIKTLIKTNELRHVKKLKIVGGSSYFFTNIKKYHVIKKVNGIYRWNYNEDIVELAKKITKLNKDRSNQYRTDIIEVKPQCNKQLTIDDNWVNIEFVEKPNNNSYKKHILYCLNAGIKIPVDWVESYNRQIK